MLFVNLFLLMIAGCVASASPSFFVFIPFYILQGASQTGLFLVAYTMGTTLFFFIFLNFALQINPEHTCVTELISIFISETYAKTLFLSA